MLGKFDVSIKKRGKENAIIETRRTFESRRGLAVIHSSSAHENIAHNSVPSF